MNRNRLLIHGQAKWLSMPVDYAAGSTQKIKDIKLSGDVRKHLRHHINVLKINYGRCRGFQTFFPGLEFVLSKDYRFLFDLDFEVLQYLLIYLEIKTPVLLASEKHVTGRKEDSLIVSIVEAAGANHILLGLGKSNEYVNEEVIQNRGVKMLSQKFSHPVYSQSVKPFVRGISVVDLLMRVPREKASYLVKHSGGYKKFKRPV